MHRFCLSFGPSILFFLLSFGTATAQRELLASGGDAQGGSGSFSWSVGQVSDHNYSGSAGYITEGVQQPAEFFLTGADVYEMSGVQLFPNPGTSMIRLKGLENMLLPAQYRILNALGQELKRGVLSVQQPVISVVELPAGVYTFHLDNAPDPLFLSFVKH
jgi:hypothetical protein